MELAAVRGVVRGIAKAIPSAAPAVEEALRAGEARLEAPVNTLLGRISRGEPGRTRTLLTLPEHEVAEIVADAVGRMDAAGRTRVEAAFADGARGLDAALAEISSSTQVRHTLLTHVCSRLGEGKVLSPGDRVASRYEIVELVGIGGMGIVYRARDTARGADVALKTLRAELAREAACVRRFTESAKLGMSLEHKGIPRVLDVGAEGDVPFLAMEWVEGPTLRAWLVERGKLTWAEAWPIVEGFLAALAYAHAKGVLHLDVKPENILLPKPDVPKLCDFDLARVLAKPGGLSLLAGAGTPDYMAPEQRYGGTVDRRADVYASGVMIYELLAGRLPGRRSPTLHVGFGIAAAISVAVEQAIDEEPSERPPNAGALLQLLTPSAASRTAIHRAAEAPPPEVRGLTRGGRNRHGYHEYENDKDGSTLVWIPGGEFVMGAADTSWRPHRVRLDGHFLGKFEVTIEQFRRFALETGSMPPNQPEEGWGYPRYSEDLRYANHPVVGVSWMTAVKYCQWAGLRLPTEAEWERAAGWDEREGSARRFPWGEDGPTARRAVSGRKQGEGRYTEEVDSTPDSASPCGAMDMAGNVWEWCGDWYDETYYDACQDGEANPKGADGGTRKSLRGGSWHFSTSWLRVCDRHGLDPVRAYPIVGFRVARGLV